MNAILVVDDRAVNRDLVRSLLTHLGHEILEAEEGSEALTLARRSRPSLTPARLLATVRAALDVPMTTQQRS